MVYPLPVVDHIEERKFQLITPWFTQTVSVNDTAGPLTHVF